MFKPGDKVKRIGNSWENAIQGKIYTVKRFIPQGVWTSQKLYIEECKNNLDYNPKEFELVINKFKRKDIY